MLLTGNHGCWRASGTDCGKERRVGAPCVVLRGSAALAVAGASDPHHPAKQLRLIPTCPCPDRTSTNQHRLALQVKQEPLPASCRSSSQRLQRCLAREAPMPGCTPAGAGTGAPAAAAAAAPGDAAAAATGDDNAAKPAPTSARMESHQWEDASNQVVLSIEFLKDTTSQVRWAAGVVSSNLAAAFVPAPPQRLLRSAAHPAPPAPPPCSAWRRSSGWRCCWPRACWRMRRSSSSRSPAISLRRATRLPLSTPASPASAWPPCSASAARSPGVCGEVRRQRAGGLGSVRAGWAACRPRRQRGAHQT